MGLPPRLRGHSARRRSTAGSRALRSGAGTETSGPRTSPRSGKTIRRCCRGILKIARSRGRCEWLGALSRLVPGGVSQGAAVAFISNGYCTSISQFILNLIEVCTSNSGFLRVAQTYQNALRWEVQLDGWFQRVKGFTPAVA